jgi:hypothetical protein
MNTCRATLQLSNITSKFRICAIITNTVSVAHSDWYCGNINEDYVYNTESVVVNCHIAVVVSLFHWNQKYIRWWTNSEYQAYCHRISESGCEVSGRNTDCYWSAIRYTSTIILTTATHDTWCIRPDIRTYIHKIPLFDGIKNYSWVNILGDRSCCESTVLWLVLINSV